MDIGFVISQSLSGITTGGLLFLAAIGLSLIFGMNQVINFAHGSIFMLSGYVALSSIHLLPPFPGDIFVSVFLIGPIGGIIIGLAIQRTVNLIRDRPSETFIIHSLILTWGIALVLGEATKFFYGPTTHPLPAPSILGGRLPLFGQQTISVLSIFLISVSMGIATILWWLIEKTDFGTYVRAAMINPNMTAALGHNIRQLRVTVFIIGSYLAGIGGGLFGMKVLVGPGTWLDIIIEAFIVVTIGGLGSFVGALVGAFIVGIGRAYALIWFGQGILLMVPFLIAAIILIIRPRGLFGREEI